MKITTMTGIVSRSIILYIGLSMVAMFAFAAELPDFTELVEKNGPAVVNISTVQKGKPKNGRLKRFPDMPEDGPFGEWFRRFFGEEGEGMDERKAQSLGSGFVISNDGYVLTNNHVIEDADKIIVRLSDRRELEAELIGTDPRSDLALLKVKAENLPVVKLGKSADLKQGEWVLAIGSPFGFDYSVTAGIVSAIGRSLPRENYVPFIQTDVAINPGNSGGPLFNLEGDVIGINSQIYSRTGGYMGLSFAIPIDVALNVVEQLKSSGHVKRGWLGVLIQDVTRELAESFEMEKPQGALVARVLPDSPAEAAGFQVGDIVLKFNGHEVIHSSDLPPMVGITPIDKKIPVDIMRHGNMTEITVEIGELPDESEIKVSSSSSRATERVLGLVVSNLTDEQRERLEINDDNGIFVMQVDGGPARTAGIQKGDVILMINNQNVNDAKQFQDIIEALPDGKSVPILIHRRGSPIFLALKIASN